MKAKELTTMAMLAVLLSASAYLTIPLGFTPTPLTLQTLFVNLTAILCTPSQSFLTVLVYILAGFAGFPVFSGGVGGPAKLFGPTGGYILAFLAAAPLMSFTKKYVCSLILSHCKNKQTGRAVAYTLNAIIFGMIAIYFLGTIYMKFLLGKSWGAVLAAAVLPFIPLDVIKCIAASFIALPLQKVLQRK